MTSYWEIALCYLLWSLQLPGHQVKVRPNLGLNISGTKHDTDKLIYSAERGGQRGHGNVQTHYSYLFIDYIEHQCAIVSIIKSFHL